MSTKPSQSPAKGNQFGTFGGVFTPSILTILGVIMFMRTGYVTGQAGILYAIIILFVAKAITFLTGLSISAISTNTKVEGGGAYYLISRSLGPEFGGSIGIALFLAQALSVPFYILGFTEAFTTSFPHLEEHFMLIGLTTTVFLFAINYVGTGWAIRAQFFILAVLVASIVVFLGGAILNFEVATFQQNWMPAYTTPDIDFWVIFAVFFPAVTGIMAGVNMSGDLAEPEKSIPRGTLQAIVVGALVYGLQILITGGSTTRFSLVERPFESILEQSLFGLDIVVLGGVWAATLSSAIGSFMGAPRILQALARDDIFPGLGLFAHGTPKTDEPRRGLWLTLGMSVGVIFYAGNAAGGDSLNAVAAVLTMFFLFTYGMTNMAAFIEQFSKNPSFRPRFRFFHWSSALLGAAGCFGAAFLINPGAAVVSGVVVVAVFVFISRRVLETTFGDARRGFHFQRLRTNLRRLAASPPDPKNWRPTPLVLTGNPSTRDALVNFGVWVENRRGICTVARVLEGDVWANFEAREQALAELQSYLDDNDHEAFGEVVVARDFDDGLAALLQSHSIGPLKPNLIMFGWPSAERAEVFARHMRLCEELGKSQVIVVDRGVPTREAPPERIDVWWRGRENGSLMVILAYLLTRNWVWARAQLRIVRVLNDGESEEHASGEIVELLEEARIEAEHIILPAERDFTQLLHEESADADAVFLGFRPPAEGSAERFHETYERFLDGLPTTLIVHSSGDASLES